MKKFLSLLAALMLTFLFVSCETIPAETITLYAPDGAPAFAVANILDGGKIGDYDVESTIVSGADPIKAAVANGEADVAVMPLNLAAILYNGGAKIKLASVNIFGNLYMVGKTPIDGLESLKGKIVYNIGRNATPDITLKYILQQNGIEFIESETPIEGKVAFQYVSAGSEIMQLFASNSIEYAVLGEPAVSTCNLLRSTSVVLDIQAEWKKVAGKNYTQAGVIISEKLAGDKSFVASLNGLLESNAEFVKTNVDRLKEILSGKGSTSINPKLTVDEGLINRSSVGYSASSAARSDVESYFNILKDFNAKLIGGKLPDEGFYL